MFRLNLFRKKSQGVDETPPIIEPQSEMMFNSSIDLEQMDPQGFEQLCAEVFRRYYRAKVEVTQYSNDKGRDLIMDGSEGKVFVECKHWVGTVGRPVVQKLDSAINHEGATGGMIVTTGRYSPGARAYAEECEPKIRLIDLAELQGIASSVGFELTMGEIGRRAEYICRTASTEELFGSIEARLDGTLESHPESPSSLMVPGKRHTEYRAFYQVSYRVDADFSTSAASNLYSVHSSGRMMIDAEGMRSFSDQTLIEDILANSTDRREIPDYASVSDPRMVQDAVRKAAASLVADRYAGSVKYKGRNGHVYSKEFRPSENQVSITGFTKVLVAETEMTYRIRDSRYAQTLMDIEGAVRWNDNPHAVCGICQKEIRRRPMLCTLCGKTVHQGSFRSEGLRCAGCGRTMCSNCAVKRGIMGRPLCPQCDAGLIVSSGTKKKMSWFRR